METTKTAADLAAARALFIRTAALDDLRDAECVLAEDEAAVLRFGSSRTLSPENAAAAAAIARGLLPNDRAAVARAAAAFKAADEAYAAAYEATPAGMRVLSSTGSFLDLFE